MFAIKRAGWAALAAAVLAFGGPAGAQAPAALHVITTPIENSAGVFFARELGLFAKHGLDVDVETMSSGEASAAAVAGGAADIGVSNALSFAIAHDQGIGLTFIAPASLYVNGSATVALVVADASGIRSAKDLTGKTVASPAINDLNAVSTERWLEKNGVDPKSVKFVELPTPQMGTAIAGHVIDAAVIATPMLSVALTAQGGRILALPYGAIANRFIINGWYARSDWLAKHRDEARRFALAVTEAQDWANKNREDSGKILLGISKIDPLVLAKMPRATYAVRFDAALLQPLIDLAARYKMIRAPFPAAALYEKLL